MKAIKKIKEKIINWLGGVDCVRYVNTLIIVSNLTYKDVKEHADSLYGLPADEWCKRMYEYLEERTNEESNEQKE